MVTGSCLSAASDVLKACFGKDGNFTVIVKDASHQELEDESTVRFRVWSSLLAQWSPVFEKMVGSDCYAESQKSEVVITDFSAGAVEMFLRFLYSGSIEGSVVAMVEVAAISDKYQVKELHDLCLHLVRQALKPELACEVFAAADQFHMGDLRAEARDLIFTKPFEALRKPPALWSELLEEILSSGLLCVTDEFLRLFILTAWGTERGRTLSLQPSMYIEARNLHTVDVLGTMWDRYRTLWALLRDPGECSMEPFHWYRVSTLLAPGAEAFIAGQSEHTSSDLPWMKRFTIRKGWVQWLLEHAWVHLQGFDFGDSCAIPASTSFRVWSSQDGVTWHLAIESHKKEIKSGTVLACERPPGLVKYFRLQVLEGSLVDIDFNIHGILQTPLPPPPERPPAYVPQGI
ncbi:bath-42 [Symbiodinium sp. CCMP2592]|nr:bath-42 [Symbiodinium sp. CCMP2592]